MFFKKIYALVIIQFTINIAAIHPYGPRNPIVNVLLLTARMLFNLKAEQMAINAYKTTITQIPLLIQMVILHLFHIPQYNITISHKPTFLTFKQSISQLPFTN